MNQLVLLVITVLFGYHIGEGIANKDVKEMYYWREVIYEDLPLDDNTIIGKYPYFLPYNNDVNGIEYHAQSGLIIATVARIRPGVPSTLNAFCTTDYEKGTSPHLWGFPDYSKNTLKASVYESRTSRKLNTEEKYSAGYYNFFFGIRNESNEGDTGRKRFPTYSGYNYETEYDIINTYFSHVDNLCNRFYVIDTGTLYYSPSEIYNVQNPAILVFDLPSNGCESRKFSMIRRVEIPNHLWQNPVGFVFITPDHQKGSCDDVFLYITNVFDCSIIVYDYKRGNFWSFTDPSMKPILAESDIPFKNTVYSLPLGIGNVALGWPDKNGDRNAYFAPASSLAEYVVSTKLLKNVKRSYYQDNSDDFLLIGYRGCNSQNYKQVFDTLTGVIFFGDMFSHKVRCWNTQLPLNPDTVGVVFESDLLGFVGEIFVDSENYLWFLANQLPLMFNSQDPLNVTEVNSRIFRVKVSDAIKGTVCDASTYSIKAT